MSGARVWLRLLPLAVLVTAVLAGIVMWASSDGISGDLASRSQSALQAAGLTGGQVTFRGRDATLHGFAADKTSQAEDVVSAVDGVRVVTVGAPISTPAAAIPSTPNTPSPSSSSPPPPSSSVPPSPAPDKPTLQKQIDAVLAASPITFEPNTAKLTPEGSQAAKQIADLISVAAVTAHFDITGHVAQGPGSRSAALKLSQSRARAVATLLTSDGVPSRRITSKASSDTQSGTATDDRRVEITVR
jgi:outer membrane protein OmpA-like peptidoglycan-associated protein